MVRAAKNPRVNMSEGGDDATGHVTVNREGVPELDERTVDADPIKQFLKWYGQAQSAGLPQADAMTLATATPNGRPSARVVLLKHVDERGFIFYTNYHSRKGKELSTNSVAAMVFLWAELNRSVRVEGSISRLSPEESDAYFRTRPRESQLGSLASAQSEAIDSRAELERRFEELRNQHEGKPIQRPPQWGGYLLKPEKVEFWQASFARLNDRVLYECQKDGRWSIKRLAP
jgi:pyridoxamine 5'-phosphate oxidase